MIGRSLAYGGLVCWFDSFNASDCERWKLYQARHWKELF